MVIGSIFLILTLAVVVFMFIFLPLIERSGSDDLVAEEEAQARELQRSTLLSERDRLLNTLLELDADNDLAKIPAGEYAPLREKLVHQAADTLRRLDELNLAQEAVQSPSPTRTDDELEKMIAARRKQLDDLTIIFGNEKSNVKEMDQGEKGSPAICTNCGKPIMPGDRYCPYCGLKVES